MIFYDLLDDLFVAQVIVFVFVQRFSKDRQNSKDRPKIVKRSSKDCQKIVKTKTEKTKRQKIVKRSSKDRQKIVKTDCLFVFLFFFVDRQNRKDL